MTTTSARPSWLKSPTVTLPPPPGEVTGAKKLGTLRSSSVSTVSGTEADFRRERECEVFADLNGNHMVVLLSRAGLRYNENAIAPGAQTERPGDAGPVRALLGG